MTVAHHVFGAPLVALVAVAVLVLLCRWVFSTADRDARAAVRTPQPGSGDDFGLLLPVTTVASADDAEALREVLRAAGVRATAAAAPGGGWSVLVFRSDAERAADLVGR